MGQSTFLAVANGLQYGVGIFIAPFADFIIDRLISPFNVLTVSLFIFGIRLYFYATVFMDPPYQIIILTLFDMLNATLSWIATLKFAFNITPHENFAIVVTMISAVQFTCGELEMCNKIFSSKFITFFTLVWILNVIVSVCR